MILITLDRKRSVVKKESADRKRSVLIDNGHISFGMQNLLHDSLVNIRSKILGE